jgi:hypothetical protein
MVEFRTEPQAPLTTIMKSQINSYNQFNGQKHYEIKILFIDVELGRKYARIVMTNQIVDGDFPHIYEDIFKCGIKDYHLRIRNHSPLWEILRKMLIKDGFLSKSDDGAILITPIELVEYLTNRTFGVKGRNIHGYKNVYVVASGDSE